MDSDVRTALQAIRDEAHRLETGHGYPMVSVRSLHQALKIELPIELVLAACAEGGFSYCLDRTIAAQHFTETAPQFPSQDVCHWGPDQLRSRLDCVL